MSTSQFSPPLMLPVIMSPALLGLPQLQVEAEYPCTVTNLVITQSYP